jgi:hypothetical protein
MASAKNTPRPENGSDPEYYIALIVDAYNKENATNGRNGPHLEHASGFSVDRDGNFASLVRMRYEQNPGDLPELFDYVLLRRDIFYAHELTARAMKVVGLDLRNGGDEIYARFRERFIERLLADASRQS